MVGPPTPDLRWWLRVQDDLRSHVVRLRKEQREQAHQLKTRLRELQREVHAENSRLVQLQEDSTFDEAERRKFASEIQTLGSKKRTLLSSIEITKKDIEKMKNEWKRSERENAPHRVWRKRSP